MLLLLLYSFDFFYFKPRFFGYEWSEGGGVALGKAALRQNDGMSLVDIHIICALAVIQLFESRTGKLPVHIVQLLLNLIVVGAAFMLFSNEKRPETFVSGR